MNRAFRDIAIGIFFLVLSGAIGLGGTKAFQSWEQAQSQKLEQQAQLISAFETAMTGALSEVQEMRAANESRYEELRKNAELTTRFIEEVSILTGARFFEDARVLSPASADELAREAISNIRENHSERMGKILEAVNDSYLRDRR